MISSTVTSGITFGWLWEPPGASRERFLAVVLLARGTRHDLICNVTWAPRHERLMRLQKFRMRSVSALRRSASEVVVQRFWSLLSGARSALKYS
jgi:hypothetical protein